MKISADLKVIENDYKVDGDIITELTNDVENVFDKDSTWNGKFNFLHCGYCRGPVIGQRPEKCRHAEGYDGYLLKRC